MSEAKVKIGSLNDDNIAINRMIELRLKLRTINLESIDTLIIDGKSMGFARPFPMLLLADVLRDLSLQYPDKKITFDYEDSCYPENVGFFDFIIKDRPRMFKTVERYATRTHVPFMCFTREIINNLIKEGKAATIGEASTVLSMIPARVLSQGNLQHFESLQYMCREIIRNTFEHSKSDAITICGQYWPMNNMVEIAFIDRGIGLCESLRSNLNYKNLIINDEDSLKFALLPGITEAFSVSKKNDYFDVWENSGYGLYMTSQICARLGGKFLIASGNSCCEMYLNADNTLVKSNRNFDLDGCVIKMVLFTDKLDNFELVKREALVEGRKEAEINELSVRNASKSSKII